MDLTGDDGVDDTISSVLWKPGAEDGAGTGERFGVYELASGSIAIDKDTLGIGDELEMELILTSRGSLWSVPSGVTVVGVLAPENSSSSGSSEIKLYKLVMATGEGNLASYTIASFNLAGETSGRLESASLSDILALERQYEINLTSAGIINRDSTNLEFSPDISISEYASINIVGLSDQSEIFL